MTAVQPPVWPVAGLVIFDCDSTLAAIEGIDELAHLAEHEGQDAERLAFRIASLTKKAMEGDLPLETVYRQRLVAMNPTQAQVRRLAGLYREKVIPDASQVVQALQALDIQVFIVSGGLIEPVREFGTWLGVPRQNIFAVDMEYDQLAGKWWRYWEQPDGENPFANHLAVGPSPLTGTKGKNRVITHIRAMHPGRAIMVGDGLSDLEALNEVDLFIGFGGSVYRARVVSESPVYIHTPSLAPVLPLALGQVACTPHFAHLWADGVRRIHAGEVSFKDPGLHSAFFEVIHRASGQGQG
jgi:phosphoserine phosphatase